MKLGTPILPVSPQSEYDAQLNRRLMDFFRQLVNKVNGLSTGAFTHSADNAATAVPTTGTYAQGDFIRNSNPTELGTAGSKYVVFGFICTVGGTPGTWLQQRMLTGN
jgi:ABC-type Fe3+/spermidine/putrescine transport system ATPase subunit